LKGIVDENEDRRKEIRMLRDNLFSGTSVLESRKSVEQTEITVAQGHNIKLLTLVNMFFLPLTFVTSIFGMTNMDPNASFWRFGVVMATVCVPFFLLIGSMNTSIGMRFWREQFGGYWMRTFRFFWSLKTEPIISRSRSSSISSDNGNEVPSKLPGRSLTASEGIAERTKGFMNMEKGSDSEPSLGPTRMVSFAKPPSKQKETHNDPANLTDLLRREARIQAISPIPSPVTPQPALTAPPSIAKSNGMSSMTEASEVSSSRVYEKNSGGGIWSKLRVSRRRSGGREDHV